MKALLVLIGAGAVALSHGQPSPPVADQDPFVGTWRANAAQSKPKLNKVEATYERVIAREGDELLFSITGGAPKAKARAFRLRCDDRFYQLPTGPALRCIYESPNRVVGETRNPTGKRQYWSREVTPDGKQMVISEFTNSRRTKVRSVGVLDRIQ